MGPAQSPTQRLCLACTEEGSGRKGFVHAGGLHMQTPAPVEAPRDRRSQAMPLGAGVGQPEAPESESSSQLAGRPCPSVFRPHIRFY